MRGDTLSGRIRKAWGAAVIGLLLAMAPLLMAQTQQTGVLTGRVTDGAGAAVANVKVTVVAADGAQVQTGATGADGTYRIAALPAGNYSVKFEAAGFGALDIPSVTIAVEGTATLDGKLEPAQKPGEPSLGDLGFPPSQTSGSAQAQARLDKRSHMLQIHQRLGLVTTIPLAATLILSSRAGGRNSTASGREWHAAVGGLTAGMYFTAASFAIFAPKVPGIPTRGPIKVHKALAWIHGPGMILTPVLGALAYQQRSRGEKVHGIASAHGAVGAITGIAYGAAMLSVIIRF